MNNLDLSPNHVWGQLTDKVNAFLPKLPYALVVALVGFLAIRLVSLMMSWVLSFFNIPKGLRQILISLIDALLAVFLVIGVLGALDLGNIALAFTAGIAAVGIALGNGSVVLVQDVLAGIYLAKDRNFNIGDIVRAGENQTEGEIMSMDMRRTRIQAKDGTIYSMPNSVIERKEYVLVTRKRDRKL